MTENQIIAGIIHAIQIGSIWLMFYWILALLQHVGGV
jgi:hypothetical protein